jgi:hypothetical protein
MVKIVSITNISKLTQKNTNHRTTINWWSLSNLGCLNSVFLILPRGIVDFVNLWPLQQWVSSLLFLLVLYTGVLRFLNWFKYTKKYFTVFTRKNCLLLFFLDILINIIIDVVVLHYQTPIYILNLVQMCPISLSPIIIIIEIVIFYYWTHWNKNKNPCIK